MKRTTWRTLKSIFLQSSEVYHLVCSWVDDADPSGFITRWSQRFFLARLVERAFREINHDGRRNPLSRVIEMEGDEVVEYFGYRAKYSKLPHQYLLPL